jgi:two-component system response regulator AtoC
VEDIVIHGRAMRTLLDRVVRVARGSVSVLVLGETGVGKDVVARVVHEHSPRRAKPFVSVNCACLSEALFESELFGYERGAFTGATSPKPGLLEEADGGTLFLDEVGELRPTVQGKLLRVLDSGLVTRLGGLRAQRVDVRIVAATNRELYHDVAQGLFRQDLFYRLRCVEIRVPSLRERAEEIEPLADFFLRRACERMSLPPLRFSDEAKRRLAQQPWPGNLRELRNAVEAACLLVEGSVIVSADLGLDATAWSSPPPGERTDGVLRDAVGLARTSLRESERIEQTLLACGGNQTRAARLLGIPRRTLLRRLDHLGLPRPRSGSRALVVGNEDRVAIDVGAPRREGDDVRGRRARRRASEEGAALLHVPAVENRARNVEAALPFGVVRAESEELHVVRSRRERGRAR